MHTMSSPMLVYQIKGMRSGHLLRRYKRFLADVVLQQTRLQTHEAAPIRTPGNTSPGRTTRKRARLEMKDKPTAQPTQESLATPQGDGITVHCPNTGPMTGLLDNLPGSHVLCSTVQAVPGKKAPVRKYAHTLEAIQPEPGGVWVGIHSALANKLVKAMLTAGLLPQLGEHSEVQQEVKYGKDGGSRVDFLLTQPLTAASGHSAPTSPHKRGSSGKCYVEVKSVTLSGPGAADGGRAGLFPDTVSERAQKHMQDLMLQVDKGDEAAVVFVVQRGDCTSFSPCEAADPKYAELVRQACKKGVQLHALGFELRHTDDQELQFWYTGPLKVVV